MGSQSIAQDKVLVAISGGVDSAVAVNILQQQGFNVFGVTISFSEAHNNTIELAKCAAQELGIPLEIVHCEEEFINNVVNPFCEAYSQGYTPNPCTICNPTTKFAVLKSKADEMGIKYIATGHYARVEEKNGYWYIAKAASHNKDQSYMLYRLQQDVLSRLCLPVGEFEKSEIREIAKEMGLSSADAPDSQEICFIPDNNYPKYVIDRGFENKKGNFINPEGDILGPHKGIIHYTVGQRKGLNIALGKPVYVKQICKNGDIKLGWGGQEYSSRILIKDIVTADGTMLSPGDKYDVKIRSRAAAVPCFIKESSGSTAVLHFESEQRAAAPGQHAVLYKDDLVIGGGIIEHDN